MAGFCYLNLWGGLRSSGGNTEDVIKKTINPGEERLQHWENKRQQEHQHNQEDPMEPDQVDKSRHQSDQHDERHNPV